MNEMLNQIQERYGYTDGLMKIINRLINSCIEVLGEAYIPVIYKTFLETYIYFYDTIEEASGILTQYYHNGKEYQVGTPATGSGFTAAEYFLDETGNIQQQQVIGIARSNPDLIQTMAHEIIHGISTSGGISINNDILTVIYGLHKTDFHFEGNKVGSAISNQGMLFNEIITENLAIQIMDAYNPNVVHEATSYQRAVMLFKNIFRHPIFNKAIMDGYFNHNMNFLEIFDQVIHKEDLDDAIRKVSSNADLENEVIKSYIAKLKASTPKDFFSAYIMYINYFITTPEGMDKKTFKEIKAINDQILSILENQLVNINDKEK